MAVRIWIWVPANSIPTITFRGVHNK